MVILVTFGHGWWYWFFAWSPRKVRKWTYVCAAPMVILHVNGDIVIGLSPVVKSGNHHLCFPLKWWCSILMAFFGDAIEISPIFYVLSKQWPTSTRHDRHNSDLSPRCFTVSSTISTQPLRTQSIYPWTATSTSCTTTTTFYPIPSSQYQIILHFPTTFSCL